MLCLFPSGALPLCPAGHSPRPGQPVQETAPAFRRRWFRLRLWLCCCWLWSRQQGGRLFPPAIALLLPFLPLPLHVLKLVAQKGILPVQTFDFSPVRRYSLGRCRTQHCSVLLHVRL